VGGDLVTNGDFATDTDWTKGTGWTIAAGVATASGATGSIQTDTSLSLIVGGTYKATIEVKNYVSGTVKFENSGIFTGFSNPIYSANGVYELEFVAVQSGALGAYGNSFNGDIDDITCQAIDPDRSVNANNLKVVGNVARTEVAPGAELMAYGPFSVTDYLEGDYTADLDFGTGDFSVSGWVKSSSTYDTILHRAISSGGLLIRTGNSGHVDVFMSADTTYTLKLTGSVAINDNAWHHVVITRDNGTLYIYVDGILDVSIGTITDITYPSAITRVGQRVDLTGAAQYLAPIRISATAPSAAQVAKMYADDLPRFNPKAQETLPGASAAVTGVAEDDELGFLHVMQSDGTSVFGGSSGQSPLVRISENSNGGTTAIAVTSGMVARK
jgi:concanavalin A-like lectin/glucanase superfamily protein